VKTGLESATARSAIALERDKFGSQGLRLLSVCWNLFNPFQALDIVDAVCADWVEHVLATGGEAYLRTPDEDLNWLTRMGVDVIIAYIGALSLTVLLIWRLGRAVTKALWRRLLKLKRS
jgi:hypothetical protein